MSRPAATGPTSTPAASPEPSSSATPSLYDADKRFGIDPADNGSLAELVDAAEEHLEHIANDVSRSVTTPANTGGDTE
jgi:hypothetical protein